MAPRPKSGGGGNVEVGAWFCHQLQERVDALLPGDRQSCGKPGN